MVSKRRLKVYRSKSRWPTAEAAWNDIANRTGLPKTVVVSNHSPTRWQWIVTSIYHQKRLASLL